MRRQDITDSTALAHEIECILNEAEENGAPAHEVNRVLESLKIESDE